MLELTLDQVEAGYGAVRVLHGISLNIRKGETVALLGTNGNGKSTLLKCLTGLVRPARGTIGLQVDDETFDLCTMSTPEIDAVNRLQSAAVDPPARIAVQIVASLRQDRARWQAGWPERLFVLLDQRWPGLLDRVLGGRWPQLRDAAQLSARSQRSIAHRVNAPPPLVQVEK